MVSRHEKGKGKKGKQTTTNFSVFSLIFSVYQKGERRQYQLLKGKKNSGYIIIIIYIA